MRPDNFSPRPGVALKFSHAHEPGGYYPIAYGSPEIDALNIVCLMPTEMVLIVSQTLDRNARPWWMALRSCGQRVWISRSQMSSFWTLL